MENSDLANWIEQDIQLVRLRLRQFGERNVEDLRSMYRPLAEAREATFYDPLQFFDDALAALSQTVRAMNERPDSEGALQALSEYFVVAAQPDAVAARWDALSESSNMANVVQRVQSAWSGIIGTLKTILTGISSALWAFIRRHLKLKEWSVSGQVSTPALVQLFGLSASAEIQLTFEK